MFYATKITSKLWTIRRISDQTHMNYVIKRQSNKTPFYLEDCGTKEIVFNGAGGIGEILVWMLDNIK